MSINAAVRGDEKLVLKILVIAFPLVYINRALLGACGPLAQLVRACA